MHTQLLEVPPITNLMVSLTNQCTMRCPFCFVDKDVKRMSYDILMSLFNFTRRNSELCGIPPRIVFFGGEPMLEWDSLIVPFTKYVREEYNDLCRLSMTTNLTLLNEERIQFLKDYNINCLFSIDGAEETMAINRPMSDGSNGFSIVDRNIDLVVKILGRVSARITLYQPTVKNFFNDVRYVESKAVGSISVLPNLFDTWSPETIAEFEKQIALYESYIIDSFRNGRAPLIFQQYAECFYRMMLVNRCMDQGLFQTQDRCRGSGKCGFGLGHFATTDYLGDIYGCLHPAPLTRDSIFYLGNPFDGVDPDKTRRLVEMCDAETPGGLRCDTCKLRAVCDRGCAPNNYIFVGKMTTPPSIYCHFYRILFDSAIRVAQVLGEEENSLFKQVFQNRVRLG